MHPILYYTGSAHAIEELADRWIQVVRITVGPVSSTMVWGVDGDGK